MRIEFDKWNTHFDEAIRSSCGVLDSSSFDWVSSLEKQSWIVLSNDLTRSSMDIDFNECSPSRGLNDGSWFKLELVACSSVISSSFEWENLTICAHGLSYRTCFSLAPIDIIITSNWQTQWKRKYLLVVVFCLFYLPHWDLTNRIRSIFFSNKNLQSIEIFVNLFI